MKKANLEIAYRIHCLRTESGISMEELAHDVGVSGKSTINEWEKGRAVPRGKNLKRLAERLSVQPDFILFGSFKHYVAGLLYETLREESDQELTNAARNYANVSVRPDQAKMIEFNPEKVGAMYDFDQLKMALLTKDIFQIEFAPVVEYVTHSFTAVSDYRAVNKEIISRSIARLRLLTKQINETLIGRSNRITKFIAENLGKEDPFVANDSLEDFLKNTLTMPMYEDLRAKSRREQIEYYFQAKFTGLSERYLEDLSSLLKKYQSSLNKLKR